MGQGEVAPRHSELHYRAGEWFIGRDPAFAAAKQYYRVLLLYTRAF